MLSVHSADGRKCTTHARAGDLTLYSSCSSARFVARILRTIGMMAWSKRVCPLA